MKPNPVVWFEIHVNDLERARRFYEAVFQCQLEPLPAPEGQASGNEMLAFPMDMPGSGAAGTLVYFGCEDCAVEQGRVVAAGGQIHKPKFSIGPYRHCAPVVDTEGNCIGLPSMQ